MAVAKIIAGKRWNAPLQLHAPRSPYAKYAKHGRLTSAAVSVDAAAKCPEVKESRLPSVAKLPGLTARRRKRGSFLLLGPGVSRLGPAPPADGPACSDMF